jgi:hypothetical protein
MTEENVRFNPFSVKTSYYLEKFGKKGSAPPPVRNACTERKTFVKDGVIIGVLAHTPDYTNIMESSIAYYMAEADEILNGDLRPISE